MKVRAAGWLLQAERGMVWDHHRNQDHEVERQALLQDNAAADDAEGDVDAETLGGILVRVLLHRVGRVGRILPVGVRFYNPPGIDAAAAGHI